MAKTDKFFSTTATLDLRKITPKSIMVKYKYSGT